MPTLVPELTVCSLGAEALGLGITAVLRGTDAFLVRVQLKVHCEEHNYTS